MKTKTTTTTFMLDNINYEVVIEKKNNKNTYLKVKNDLKIYVTTNYLISDRMIHNLLEDNRSQIRKMIQTQTKRQVDETTFLYLGKCYDIVYLNTVKDLSFGDDIVFINPNIDIDKWYKREAFPIFEKQLKSIYSRFEEDIPYPKLKLRKMKTRWGVCNRKDNSVTLNTELMKKRLELLDYVIIHELSHFVEFNHSKKFWNVVEKYLPNYKILRKELKY